MRSETTLLDNIVTTYSIDEQKTKELRIEELAYVATMGTRIIES